MSTSTSIVIGEAVDIGPVMECMGAPCRFLAIEAVGQGITRCYDRGTLDGFDMEAGATCDTLVVFASDETSEEVADSIRGMLRLVTRERTTCRAVRRSKSNDPDDGEAVAWSENERYRARIAFARAGLHPREWNGSECIWFTPPGHPG